MNGKSSATAEQTRNKILDLLVDSYRGIESAVAYSLNQFEQDGEDLEIFHYVDTVRYKTKIYLQQKGYDVKDLSLNGLHVSHNGYEIKLLKDDGGLIPPAKHSKTRLNFYRQIYQREHQSSLFDIFLEAIKENDVSESKNLVLLYKIGKQGQLLGLELFCTDGAKSEHDSPTAIWSIEVPHPADISSQGNQYERPIKDANIFDDADEQDSGDIDIFKDGTND